MVALTGESGAGTTTLLNIIGCLDVPTEGRYLLDGTDMGQLSRHQLTRIRAEKIGIVSPSFDLLPDANVLRNLELPLLYVHVESRQRRAHRALRQIGLDAHHEDMPPQLLPGQRHQVLIARAMINNPPVLLYDPSQPRARPPRQPRHHPTTDRAEPRGHHHRVLQPRPRPLRPRQPDRGPARRADHPRPPHNHSTHHPRPDTATLTAIPQAVPHSGSSILSRCSRSSSCRRPQL